MKNYREQNKVQRDQIKRGSQKQNKLHIRKDGTLYGWWFFGSKSRSNI